MKDFVFIGKERWCKPLLTFALFLISAFQIGAVTLNSTNFPDANFRSALASTLGISEGANFDATIVQSLDLTGKGITNLTGIANFTAIKTLILDDNDLDFLFLESNTALEVLSIKNNDHMIGFSTTKAQAGAHYINLSRTTVTPLREFYADGSAEFAWFSSVYSVFKVNTIEKISLKDCPKMAGWAQGISDQKNSLKYLDLTNTTQTTAGLNATTAIPSLTKLETLILANNSTISHVNVSALSQLKHLDLSGNDIYFRNGTSSAYYQLHYLTASNNPLLETLNVSNSKIGTNSEAVTGFQNLKTFIGGGNNTNTLWTINNCPSIAHIDVSGGAKITVINITNSNLATLPTITTDASNSLLTTLNLNGNQFTDVPTEGVPSTVKFMTLQQNNFAADYMLNGATNLTGLDLGRNSFTKLTVTNTDLHALSLDACASLATLEMHGNESIVKTAESNDITASAGEGVYIKGLSALKTLNIENSNFTTLGQESSTQGCTGIETLKASHNKFTTFSNAYTSFSSLSRAADKSRPSLEHLTGLKYLDLSHNELQDSVHLFKNTKLETLILNHNRSIKEYGTLENYLANSEVVNQGNAPTSVTVDKKTTTWHGYVNKTTKGKRYIPYDDVMGYDVGAFNDTTGLRMLNLIKNVNLKYVDISHTYIENTAAAESYMANFQTKFAEVPNNVQPSFVYIAPTHNTLEEFYADYNGMKTFGFINVTYSKLKRISQVESRGQDAGIMQGSLNPNRSGMIPNLEYLDISNSNLDSIGVTNCKNLKYLNVSGNFTNNNKDYWVSKSKWNAQDGRGFVLNLTGCDNIVECRAENIPYIHTVLASNRPTLSSLNLSQDPTNTQLKNIFVDNTGLPAIGNQAYTPSTFPTRINSELELTEQTASLGLSGLSTCPNLQLIYCNNNNALKALDVTENASLKYLHAYNNAYGEDNSDASGLNLANNVNLVTAWVSNSGLQSLDATNHATLDTLKCYDNAHLQTLTVNGSASMRYLDLARCHVANLDLSSNTGLKHFDCSNDVKCTTEAGNWISDLDLSAAATLETVIANNNNLYSLKAPAATLTKIEFAHNHINGIDLSHATALASANIPDEDNGRTITAEASVLTKHNETGTAILAQDKIYYLQLVENAGDAKEGHNSFLEARESVDELKQVNRPSLADDGMTVAKVTNWTSGFSGIVEGSRKAASASDLDSEKTYGKIVVLTPTAEDDTNGAYGRVTYKYNNGISDSEFYLDWSAAASLVTEVEEVSAVKTVDKVVYVNAMGQESAEPFSGVNIVVTHYTDGSTSSVKILK